MDEQTTTQSRATDARLQLERQFAFFACLFSLATLWSVWQRLDFPDTWATTLQGGLLLMAFLVMLRRTWVLPFVVLSGLHFLYSAMQLPYISTTDTLWLFFSAAILASAATGWLRQQYNLRVIGLYRAFVPCLRIMFVLSLIATSIARLNWNFLDFDFSPVVPALDGIRPDMATPAWAAYFAMSMLLIVDLWIAIALLVPRLRRFAVGVGSAYFAAQAVLGFGDARAMFPLMMLGLYAFLSTEVSDRISTNLQRWIPFRIARTTVLPTITGLVAVTAILMHFDTSRPESQPQSQWLVMSYFGLMTTIWVVSLAMALVDQRPKLTWVSLLLKNPLHYGLVLLFLATICSPYLGWGSYGRFSETSGLIVGEDHNNHLVIPQFDLAGNRNDLIQVVASSDPYLQGLAEAGSLIPWFELVNYANQNPEIGLTLLHGDDEVHFERAGDNPELMTRNPWIIRKLLGFHIVDKAVHSRFYSRQVAQP